MQMHNATPCEVSDNCESSSLQTFNTPGSKHMHILLTGDSEWTVGVSCGGPMTSDPDEGNWQLTEDGRKL